MATFQIPIPTSPVSDPKTGLIAREWYLFLNSFYQAAGSSTGGTVTVTDTQLLFAQQRTVPAEVSTLANRVNGIESLLLMIRDERSEVSGLKQRIKDLESLIQSDRKNDSQLQAMGQRIKEMEVLLLARGRTNN